jgi:hypothetical protein
LAGTWCSLVNTLPCQGRDHGFESRRPRQNAHPEKNRKIVVGHWKSSNLDRRAPVKKIGHMVQRRAQNPFQFVTRINLIELTGLKARTLQEMLDILRTANSSIIYHHTHHFLKQHQSISPEPPNDFSYWVTAVLNDEVLGEQLASIDTVQFTSLYALRDRIVQVMERHVDKNPNRYTAPEDEAFHFMKSLSFILPTPYHASDLNEFSECVKKISPNSLYHHIFESRLRLEKGTNDFSAWFEKELGEKDLARAVARLDPYTQTMESLRHQILRLVMSRLQNYALEGAARA